MTRPIIAISMDLAEDARGRLYTVHQIRAAYVEAVIAAGGAPILLAPMDGGPLRTILGGVGGVVLTGGAFDIPPAMYDEAPSAKLGEQKPARTEFERRLLAAAGERQLAVLGICGGMQLMNVAAQGSLYQHLPDDLPSDIAHEQSSDRREPSHAVAVRDNTLLARLVGAGPLPVNSSHHQGVKRLGDSLVASAHSADGLVEAIEDSARRWLGVEWHPELLGESEPRHQGIFRWLVDSARTTGA